MKKLLFVILVAFACSKKSEQIEPPIPNFSGRYTLGDRSMDAIKDSLGTYTFIRYVPDTVMFSSVVVKRSRDNYYSTSVGIVIEEYPAYFIMYDLKFVGDYRLNKPKIKTI